VRYEIDPDIAIAETLPGAFYHDATVFESCRERVFARSWQWLGGTDGVAQPGTVSPRTVLPGLLNEPVFLARDAANVLRCFPNVCTHRGNVLVTGDGAVKDVRCGYHSRRFDFAGRMTFMPGFESAHDFPRDCDHLKEIGIGTWRGFAWAALDAAPSFDDVLAPMRTALEGLWPSGWTFDPASRREYSIHANWALYVENYLEGFHIPYVHPALSRAVDVKAYRTQCFHWAVRQTAWAREGDIAFAEGAIRGETGRIAADYWWIYPNLMLNVYPWGVSVNVVLPEAIDRTKVIFESYVADPALRSGGAGGALDTVEMEDEAIVEAVQRGTASRFYGRGRYSPTQEQGTHHFHRLLAAALA
jgi:choline monooxygenase